MAESKEFVTVSDDHHNVLNETTCIDDELADDDSWAENVSEDDEDYNNFEIEERELETDPDKIIGYSLCHALDFTLHTIVEESCEDSELEQCGDAFNQSNEITCGNISSSDLERYFFFGLGNRDESNNLEDSSSEIFSDFSDVVESIDSNTVCLNYTKSAFDLSTSRLEKYFLTGFMGFGIENKSDGSVGSDSEGQPSPSQRKKKLRARGTPRSNHSSSDNLLVEPTELQGEQLNESLDTSESETGIFSDEVTLCDKPDNPEPIKRKKNYRKRDLFDPKLLSESGNAIFLKNDLSDESRTNFTNTKKQNFAMATSQEHYSNETNCTVTKTSLVRTDSFNNWSSDEETNLMMSKMRQFFKTLIAVKTNCSNSSNYKTNDIEFSYFDSELIRLMKTVPGINNEQVREIVEYLSSEDTWSDSNDSLDLNAPFVEMADNNSEENRKAERVLRRGNVDLAKRLECAKNVTNINPLTEDTLSYSNLMNSILAENPNLRSLGSITADKRKTHNINSEKSHQLIANVWKHMGKKLISLMHEVSIGTNGNAIPYNTIQDCQDVQKSINQNAEENIKQHILDNLDCATIRSSQEDNLTRSKSHDVLLESGNRSWHFNSVNAVNENNGEVSDYDRFSWRGSFESTLLAPGDSRNKLLTVDRDNGILISEKTLLKRGSVDNLPYISVKKKEQLDRVQSCGSISRNDDRNCAETHKLWLSSLTNVSKPIDLEASSKKIIMHENLKCTNSLPGLQSLEISANTFTKSDFSCVQSSVKSARYRSPTIQYTICSKNTPTQTAETKLLPIFQKNLASSLSLDDVSVSSEIFSKINNSPDLQANRIYKRNSTYFGKRSDSMTSVYSDTFDNRYGNIKVRGQIKFGMQYNYKIGALEVHIVRCKDLAAADLKKCKSDPYVKLYLLPDKSKRGKRKTKIKKQALHPVFDETVRFFVPLSSLRTRSLWLTVWHSGIFGRNDFLGEVTINLAEKVFDKPQSQWYNLQEKNGNIEDNPIQRGDLVIALKFITSKSFSKFNESSFKLRTESHSSKGQLHVLIKEAKNLHNYKATGACDTFCKSYLLPIRTRSSKQKTPIFKKSLNPIWNHTFTYDGITVEELSERALELTIWEHDSLISNQFIGGARISLGTGLCCGNEVSWMDSRGKEIYLWREMMSRPNFWVEGSVQLRSEFNEK